MPRTWFTADTHFGHANIIKHCNRPFASVEEMDAELVRRWNETVSPEDTVWHLGDFAFGRGVRESMRELCDVLNGRKHILVGNHDIAPVLVASRGFLIVKAVMETQCEHDRVFASHYAHRVWPNKHRGVYHLWGHSHGTLPPERRSIDVGVDCWDYRPVSLDQIKARLEELGLGQHETFDDR